MKRKARTPLELYDAMRIAIEYTRELVGSGEKYSASKVAKVIGMSTSRFEHAFLEWAGTTPKRFVDHLIKNQARKATVNSKDVLQAAYSSGMSGPNKLTNLLVTHEAVTPGELKKGNIEIKYGVHMSLFGWCAIGITKRGVCHLMFQDSKNVKEASSEIKKNWPTAVVTKDEKETEKYINKIFNKNKAGKRSKKPIHLLIKGTNFQIKVWEALLSIPPGKTVSYTDIARAAGFSKAMRAVGSACGKNTIGYLIPCHRVLTSTGSIGGYRWGAKRKEAMLARESVSN